MMKTTVILEKEKMSERDVRESIERASATARNLAQQKGEREPTHESVKAEMVKNAEYDRKQGKI